MRPGVLLIAMGLGLAAGPAIAAPAPDAVLHAVQPPAWVERGEQRLPARPGANLRTGEVLRTGDTGRAQVDLPEGSRVKLGSGTRFRSNRIIERQDADGSLVDAAIEILKGAFRFTTGLAGEEKRRSVDIRAGALTAGIRGTDLWGRSGDDGDFIVLLEGRIEMSTSGMAPEVLTEALDARIVPPGSSQMQPMPDVTPELIQRLAPETELDPERGALSVDGELQLVLASVRRPRAAEAVQARLEAAGYPAYIEAVPLQGRMWHRVVIDNVIDHDNGRRLGQSLVGRYGVESYWLRPME